MFNKLFYGVLKSKVRNLHGKGIADCVSDLMDAGRYTPGLWSLVHGRPVWSDKRGAVGELLKYGHIKGFELFVPIPMGASEVIKAASGRFLKFDTSGRGEVAGDTDTELIGHVELADQTTSSTEGGTVGALNIALDCVYRIPVNSGTYAAAMRWNTTDLSVSSNIQGVQLAGSTEDVVYLVDGDTDNNNWVDLKLNPNKMFTTGVV